MLPDPSIKTLTVGSLFAGIGGIDLGLERTGGFKTVWQVENNDYATRVLEKHWPDVRRWGDIRAFLAYAKRPRTPQPEGSEQNKRRWIIYSREKWRVDNYVDLICGGFPCQPISSAGKQRGESDERWLWDEMRRVCAIFRPTWVLAENVPGLLSARDVRGQRGALFGRVVRDLASLGYRVRWDCVPAAAVGAPHIRDRVFIVAYCEHSGHRWREQQQEGSESAGNVADATQPRQQDIQGQCSTTRSHGRAEPRASGVCHTDQPSQGAEPQESRSRSPVGESSWWSIEPDVGRVAYGVPKRVDRLRCLGNAVVPQVAQWIGERILDAT